MRLGLDPGHGGARNIGTTAGGISEKDENLRLVLELAGALPQAVELEMLRHGDEYVSFGDRAGRAGHCDWVMSVHVNAARNPRQRKAEVYILSDSPDEFFVARRILSAMPHELRSLKVIEAVDPRPEEAGDWQEAPINVLKHHTCKRLLVEVCYASNRSDLQVLQSTWGRMAIVSALRAGVAAMMHPAVL